MIKYLLSIFLISLLTVKISSCCKDKEDLPLTKLTDAELEWTKIYVMDAIFHFRNQDGEEQSYQIGASTIEEQDDWRGEISWAQNRFQVWRVEINQLKDNNVSVFQIYAQSPGNTYIGWSNFSHNVPISDFEKGSIKNSDDVEYLPSFKVNSITYKNVLKFDTFWEIDTTASFIRTLYYDKEHGVIRFDLMNKEIWTRQ